MRIKQCRGCSSNSLKSVLDLGDIYPSTFLNSNEKPKGKYPLHLCQCEGCRLVQLFDTVDLDLMYRQYWYKSSLNQSMVMALQDVVTGIQERIELTSDDAVLDIGCNDGTLLSLFHDDLYKVGFDPALNLKSEALLHCNIFINDYFKLQDSEHFYLMRNQFKAITSIAMFYDLENPNEFIKDVKAILHPEGIWVIQFSDLVSMLRANAFDNICHEHLEYYSLSVLIDLLFKHDLDVFDVEYNKVNGGSIRAYVCHKDARKIKDSVVFAERAEKEYLNRFDDPLQAFADRVKVIRFDLVNFLMGEREDGKRIYALGASTKGNTLLQYFRLDSSIIEKVAEVNKDKFGLKTVGSNIPIISEEQALLENPDYFLVLPWHFKDFFVKKFESYLDNGGKLIFPLGEPLERDLTWL